MDERIISEASASPALKYTLLAYFAYQHLPLELQGVSMLFHDLAYHMIDILSYETLSKIQEDEVVIGLHKLLESKDCFVRAFIQPKT